MSNQRGGLVFLLAVWSAAAVSAAVLFLLMTHTLARNGRWSATKTRAEVPLMGALSYTTGRQPLWRGMLNLGSWYGFHEVMLEEAVEPVTVEARVLLVGNAWLAVMLRDGEEYHALRLGTHPAFPSAWLRGSEEDGFSERRVLSWKPRLREWHRLRLELTERATVVWIDGERVAELDPVAIGTVRVGFRGGYQDVFVEDLAITDRSGRELFESFRPRRAVRVVAAAVLIFLAFVGLSFFVLRRWSQSEPRRLILAFALAGTVLTVVGIILCFFVALRPPSYPWLTTDMLAEERAARKQYIVETGKQLMRSTRGRKRDGVYRILFLGSSQTFGSGAMRASETFVERIERRLNEGRDDLVFECLNSGVPSAKAFEIARLYLSRWHKLAPDLLVIDLSNNDRDNASFAEAIEEILDQAAADGVPVVLVAEPNSIESPGNGIDGRHRLLAELGHERGLSVVPMHELLAARADEGFLWWDKVHLTSFGHRLFAEELLARLTSVIPSPAEPAGSSNPDSR